jgi:hypothetical protein
MCIPQDSETIKIEEQFASLAKELHKRGTPRESIMGYIVLALDETPPDVGGLDALWKKKQHDSHSKEEQTAQSLRVYQVAMRLQHSHGLGMCVTVEEGDTDYICIKVDEKVGSSELFWNFDVQDETWKGHLSSDMGDTIGHCETHIPHDNTDISLIAAKIAEAVKDTFKTFPLVTTRHDKESGRLTLFKWNPEGGGNFVALTINTSHVSNEESYVETIEHFITLVNGLCPS